MKVPVSSEVNEYGTGAQFSQTKKQFCHLWKQEAVKFTHKHSLTNMCCASFKTFFWFWVVAQIVFGGVDPLALVLDRSLLVVCILMTGRELMSQSRRIDYTDKMQQI